MHWTCDCGSSACATCNRKDRTCRHCRCSFVGFPGDAGYCSKTCVVDMLLLESPQPPGVEQPACDYTGADHRMQDRPAGTSGQWCTACGFTT